MSKAIGMIEYKTVSAGVVAADAMVKTSDVSIIEAQTVCPGKYIVIITGDLSAVDAAVNTARVQHEEQLISSFVLGNPHESIFPAIYGATEIEEVSALGEVDSRSTERFGQSSLCSCPGQFQWTPGTGCRDQLQLYRDSSCNITL